MYGASVVRSARVITFFPLLLIAISVSRGATAARQFHRAGWINLPGRRTIRIPSPNGRWILIASPVSLEHDSTLVIEERTSGRRMLVRRYDRSMGVGWSPDSTALFLDDAFGSDEESAYIYWPAARKLLLLDKLILDQDPEAKNVDADHTYFQVRRWISSTSIIVEYCGHGSGSPARQFDFLYRGEIHGPNDPGVALRRISSRVVPVSFGVSECLP